MRSAQPETICQFEFVAEFRRLQVLAQVHEPLLQGEQRCGDCFSVGVGNVAPHGIRAGSETRHFAQGAAADGAEVLVVREFFFEQSAERS